MKNCAVNAMLCGLLSFALSLLIAPPVIKTMKKLKASQTILGYVEQHCYKNGTPTIGGVIFIIPSVAVALIFGYSGLTLVASAVALSYALLGFLDDFLKVKAKRNLGLRAYQKVIGQLGIAAIVSIYCLNNPSIGGDIAIPFTTKTFSLGAFYLPFTVFVYIAVTNSVNLTDGLDGLAATVTSIYLTAFFAILLLSAAAAFDVGQAVDFENFRSLLIFTACFIGGLSGFLCFNSYPAKIMMGDTGSLALGGVAATVAVFTKNPLIIPIVGIMYAVSSISVIVQVIYFKLTGKRVFLMSPFHHHLEKKGLHEAKIVTIYGIVTAVAAVVAFTAVGGI